MRRILFLSVFAAFLVGFGFGEIQAQLPHTIDLDEGEEDVRILGDDYAGYSGAAVASGDVNGDGIDDIIIGAPNGDTDGRSDEGEVYVIYGKANLPDKIGLGGKVSVRIMGAYEGDEFGASVACGDVNGDGIDDIIIGAPGVDVNDLSDEGAAYVIFGSASLPDTIEVYGWHGSEKGVPGIENNGYVVIWGFYNGGRVGQAVATGDVNGDGVGDIIVGAPGVDVVTDSDEGETYVIFGSASLPSDIYLDSDEDVLIVGNGDEANSGWALASGDVNGDGIDDIIIGAPGADTEEPSEEGKTYIILGSNYALYGETIWLDDDEDVVILGDDEYDHSGAALATGDVNGDGIDDIIVGAPYADTDLQSEEGKTYVILGSEDLGDEIDEIWLDEGEEDVVILGDDEEDYSGWAVATGDVDGDGIDDIIIGAPETDPLDILDGGGGKVVSADLNYGMDAGKTYIIYGSEDLGDEIDEIWLDDEMDVIVLGAEEVDEAGFAVGSGDVNGDGIDDVIIGAPWANTMPDFSDEGETYIILGMPFIVDSLDVSSPGGVQHEPFPVTVTPYDLNDEIYTGPIWIDLSASEPGVLLPQGDQLLVGPRTFMVIATYPSDSLLIDAERVKIWDPDLIVYGRSERITVLPGLAYMLDSLVVTSPGGVQNVPFPVTVTPWSDNEPFYEDSVWIDLSASEPGVLLPQGDQLLVGPRTFMVIATYPSDSLLIDAERVKIWDPDLIVYGRSDTLVIIPEPIDSLASLFVVSRGGMQNVPFRVEVVPIHMNGRLYTDSIWIDLSASEPGVLLPQGDQLLEGPRDFTVIATSPTNRLVIDAERVKIWDPDLIVYGRSDWIIIEPAFIDQPDELIVSDLPNDQGGYIAVEWDYSDNHPGLGLYNTIDYYQVYRKIYPILDYRADFYPWDSPWDCNGSINLCYEDLDCSTGGYRARMTFVQETCGPPWWIQNVQYYAWRSWRWITMTPLEQPGNPDIMLTERPKLYTFEIPDAAVHPTESKMKLRVKNLSGVDAVLSEVWIEKDNPLWYQYGTAAAPPIDRVPDPVGKMRIIMPDYGFPGTASDYFVQAVVTHIYPKAEGDDGAFVLDVRKVAGGLDESALCGPAFGRSVDNIPPADPMDIRIIGGEVSWSLSPDDRLLETGRDWLGNPWEIHGVTDYVLFRNGEYVGMVDRGTTSWTDVSRFGGEYRVYAFDGTNLSMGLAPVTVQPTAYALHDNYPNPFNPETSISYTLPEAARVRVEVYNALGQVVEVLVDGDLEAGSHVVKWEAGAIASGVYFYRIRANKFTSTKRMILMK